MQHLTLTVEAAMAEYFYPVCGDHVFWCVAGVEFLFPVAIALAILCLWRSIA